MFERYSKHRGNRIDRLTSNIQDDVVHPYACRLCDIRTMLHDAAEYLLFSPETRLLRRPGRVISNLHSKGVFLLQFEIGSAHLTSGLSLFTSRILNSGVSGGPYFGSTTSSFLSTANICVGFIRPALISASSRA